MTQHEKFAWIALKHRKGQDLILTMGDGYCTMKYDVDGYATVQQLREKRVPGSLCSSTAILVLRDGVEDRYVMIERDAGASIDPLKWQFPAGRMERGETPFETAHREAAEEVEVLVNGHPLNIQDAVLVEQGQRVVFDYTTHEIVTRCEFVEISNTLEFFIPVVVEVEKGALISCVDKEPYGRKVSVFTKEQLLEYSRQGLLTGAAACILDAWNKAETLEPKAPRYDRA